MKKYKYLNTPWRIEWNSYGTKTCIRDCFNNNVLINEWYHQDYSYLLKEIINQANKGYSITTKSHIKHMYAAVEDVWEVREIEAEEYDSFDFMGELKSL